MGFPRVLALDVAIAVMRSAQAGSQRVVERQLVDLVHDKPSVGIAAYSRDRVSRTDEPGCNRHAAAKREDVEVHSQGTGLVGELVAKRVPPRRVDECREAAVVAWCCRVGAWTCVFRKRTR